MFSSISDPTYNSQRDFHIDTSSVIYEMLTGQINRRPTLTPFCRETIVVKIDVSMKVAGDFFSGLVKHHINGLKKKSSTLHGNLFDR